MVEVRDYTLGEVILREGSDPKYFYLISSGRVKIVKEEIILRDAKIVGKSDTSEKKKLKFSKIDCRN